MPTIWPPSYSPVRINSPKLDQTVRLQCGQAISVILPPPKEIGLPDGSEWVYTIDSPFLKADDARNVGDDSKSLYPRLSVIYRNEQFNNSDCDPRRWVNISTLFLGNVRFYLRDKGQILADKEYVLYCYQDCENKKKSDVITVVCPTYQQNCYSVKVQPQQLLEVVYDDDGGLDNGASHYNASHFYYYPPTFSDEDIVRCPTLQKRHEERLGRNMPCSSAFTISDPYFSSRRIQLPSGHAEVHRFYGFPAPDVVQWQDMTCGLFDAGHMSGFNKEGKKCLDMKIKLDFKKKHLKSKNQTPLANIVSNVVNATRSSGEANNQKSSVASTGKASLVTPSNNWASINRRDVDKTQNILRNPYRTDEINIEDPSEDWIIEIETPQYFFNLPSLGEMFWRCNFKHQYNLRDQQYNVSVKSLANRNDGNRVYQRYEVSLHRNPSFKGSSTLLGTVIFQPQIEHPDLPSDAKRCIKLQLATPNSKTVKLDDDVYHVRSYTEPKPIVGFAANVPYNNKSKNYSTSQLAVDTFYKVEVTYCGDRLDNELKYIHSKLNSNKKSADDSFSFGANQKKNSTGTQKDSKDESKENYDDSSNCFQTTVTLPKNQKAKSLQTEEGVEKSGDTEGDVKSIEVYMFSSNKQSFTLVPRQSVIVRLPLPVGNYKNSAIRQQWTPNIVNLQAEKKIQVWIRSNDIIEPDENNAILHQRLEIGIVSPPNIKSGTYVAGSVVLKSGTDTKQITLVLCANDSIKDRTGLCWQEYNEALRACVPKRVSGFRFYDHAQYANRTVVHEPLNNQLDITASSEVHEVDFHFDIASKIEADRITFSLMQMIGTVEVIDRRIYRANNGTLRLRVLVRCEMCKDGHDARLYTEIRIEYDGKRTSSRFIVFGSAEHARQISKPITGGKITYIGVRDAIRLSNWKDGETVYLRPSDTLYVEVPTLDNYLSTAAIKEEGRWQLVAEEQLLPKAVLERLSNAAQDTVRCIAPYSNKLVFGNGCVPWDCHEVIVPSVATIQPYLKAITKECTTAHGPNVFLSLGSLKFRYSVNNDFVITKTLKLAMTDVSSFYKTTPVNRSNGRPEFSNISNPLHRTEVVGYNGQKIVVRFKSKNSCSLRERPNWLAFFGTEIVGEEQICRFMIQMPSGCNRVKGKCVFLVDDDLIDLIVDVSRR